MWPRLASRGKGLRAGQRHHDVAGFNVAAAREPRKGGIIRLRGSFDRAGFNVAAAREPRKARVDPQQRRRDLHASMWPRLASRGKGVDSRPLNLLGTTTLQCGRGSRAAESCSVSSSSLC